MSLSPTLGAGIGINIATLLETRLLVQASSGGGKSWALRRLLEQTANHVQHLIIDPEGEFSTLREKHDYVVAAAHGGDALAHPRTAALLARRLLETGVSAVIDIYDLRVNERQTFVRLFCEAMVNAPRALWRPVLLVIDEAHVFCPEGSRSESAGAVIDVVTRGRKRGFGTILATQRLSKLHKDAAAEMLNKLIGRTGLDIDVKRAADELGMSPRDAMDALRKLQPGEFFAFGPALTAVPTKVAVGQVATTHPKAGERMLSAPPAASPKIRAALKELADLPAAAEEEAKTMDDLRREVTDLKRKLTAAEKRPPVDESALNGAKAEIANLRARIDSLHAALTSVQQTAASALAMTPTRAAPTRAEQGQLHVIHATAQCQHTAQRINRMPDMKAIGGEGVTGAKKRILDALAQLEVFGLATPDRRTVAAHARMSPQGGHTTNTISALRTAGLLDYPANGLLALTEAGRAAATYPAAPPTLADLHASWLSIVSGLQQRILQAVIDAHPDGLTREELADRVSAVAGGGHFTNTISALRTLGALDYPRKGWVVATEAVFPK